MSKGVAVAPERPASQAMSFERHLIRTARFAGPVILARAGLLVMVAIDSAMLGHYGTASLAYYAAANAAQVVMILIGVGLLQGTTISGRAGPRCARPCRLRHVLARELGPRRPSSASLMGLHLPARPLDTLEATGQEPEVALGGGRVLDMIAWGLPPLMMWVVCSHFLEGISRPIPGMLVMFGAVLLNVAAQLDPHLRPPGAGPEMGAEGAAIATSLVRWVMFGALLLVRAAPARRPGARHTAGGSRTSGRSRGGCRRLGYPARPLRGASRPTAFAALVMLAGNLGTVSLAAYQIGYNLIGLVFMVAIGTAGGEHDPGRQRGGPAQRRPISSRAGWAGVSC